MRRLVLFVTVAMLGLACTAGDKDDQDQGLVGSLDDDGGGTADAGCRDAGVVTTDAATEPFPDAGDEPFPDAGGEPFPDAGGEPFPDAGGEQFPDAGGEPAPDAGTGPNAPCGDDAGTGPLPDAGGPVPDAAPTTPRDAGSDW